MQIAFFGHPVTSIHREQLPAQQRGTMENNSINSINFHHALKGVFFLSLAYPLPCPSPDPSPYYSPFFVVYHR